MAALTAPYLAAPQRRMTVGKLIVQRLRRCHALKESFHLSSW
jgi:hypothetical protein